MSINAVRIGRAYNMKEYGPDENKNYTTTYFQFDSSYQGKEGRNTKTEYMTIFRHVEWKPGAALVVWGETSKRQDKQGNWRDNFVVDSWEYLFLPKMREEEPEEASQQKAPQNKQKSSQKRPQAPQPSEEDYDDVPF